MKPDALQELGEEKLVTIINLLVNGESTMSIARTIQEQWGEAQDLSRGALEKELTRLRMSIDRGGLRSDLAEPPSSTSRDALELRPLGELESLAALQKSRIEELSSKEREQGKPLPALTAAFKAYENTLFRIQAMRFDMGVDICKRVKITSREWLAAQEAREREKQNQAIEAYKSLDDIFKKRAIRLPGTEHKE